MKKSPPQFVLIIFLALLAPLGAQETHSGSWSQATSGTLAAARNVRIKLDMGAVVVHGSQRSDISYTMHGQAGDSEMRRHYGSMHVSTSVKGDTAWIIGEWEGGRPHRFSGEFVVEIPRDTALLKIETGGGGVDAAGITGAVEVESGGGKVHLDDIGGSATAQTGGDSINIGNVGGDLKLETGGGNISIGMVKGRIKAETGGGNVSVTSGGQDAVVEAGGGNVEIRHCSGGVKATTGGGSISLGDIGGPAQIETGGGSIHLTSAQGRVGANAGAGSIELYGVPSAKVETGAGGITVKFINGNDRSDSMLETSAGDITVYISPGVALSVRASVEMGSGHHISSDFPDIHVSSQGNPWVKTLTAEGKLNGGGPVLKVRTATGDICFRKAQ
ncbi:MAG TPA: hypothetical protein VND65_08440 [Candidatus Binatia bacterium]|nr:hypothetical protein [Candidatus Binatia bacterium]